MDRETWERPHAYRDAACYDAARSRRSGDARHGNAPGEDESTIPNRQSKISRRPKLGQHFLHDQRYRLRILEALSLNADDIVMEIGPGRGAMTALLAQRARRVIAIEIDRALAQRLEEDFRRQPKVQVVLEDVLRVDLAALCRAEGAAQAFVFGNIPYYITSPILHHLLAQRQSIRAMGLLMQREVAERLTASPGTRDYGYLSVAAQLYSQPEIALDVPPGAFSPAPQVQSALVTFRLRPKFAPWPPTAGDKFLEFVKRCFAQKRKNLLNNLSGYYPRTEILKALEGTGNPATSRAEQLSVEALASLFESLCRAA